MKTVFIILLCLLVFFGCLAIGVFSGDFAGGSPQTTSSPTTPPTQTSPLNFNPSESKQQNLVLVFVDQLGPSSFRLEAIWLLLSTQDQPDLILLLLYPSPKEPYKNLAEQFKLTPDGKFDASFIEVLRGFKFDYQGFVLIDEAGLGQWVDWMNGIEMDGSLYNGTAVLNYIPKPWDDFDNSLTHQMTVANGLCTKLGQLPKDKDGFALLTQLFPDHMSTDLTLENTVVLWKNIMAGEEKLKCKTLSP
jgi:hypothetical protein